MRWSIPLCVIAMMLPSCRRTDEAKPLPREEPSVVTKPAGPRAACRDGRVAVFDTPDAATAEWSDDEPNASSSKPSPGTGMGYSGSSHPRFVVVPLDVVGAKAQAIAEGACAARDALWDCGAEARLEDGNVAGSVELELSVDATGKVDRAALVAWLAPALNQCVQTAFQKQVFGSDAQGRSRVRIAFLPQRFRLLLIETGIDMDSPLAPEVIKRAIRARFPQMRRCYALGVASDVALSGTIKTTFGIDTTGKIVDVRSTEGTLPDDRVRRCVAAEFERLSFEPAKKPSKVVYPLDFAREIGD